MFGGAVDIGEDDCVLGLVAVRDPRLRAVQHVLLALALRRRRQRRRVAPVACTAAHVTCVSSSSVTVSSLAHPHSSVLSAAVGERERLGQRVQCLQDTSEGSEPNVEHRLRLRFIFSRVRPRKNWRRTGFGEREAADLLAGHQRTHEALLLLGAAELQQREHVERLRK